MRFKIKLLALLLMVVCVMSSCLDSDDTEIFTYDDTAVTAVTLGTLKCYRHTLSSKGVDSVYSISVTGSSYHVYIDQLKHEIYNVDSLPMGTDMAHVLMTVSTKNGGVAVLKSITSDSVRVINSTDSLDFTLPRELTVYSQSGWYNQKYTVRLSAHQEMADSFRWSRLADSEKIAAYKSVKAQTLGDNLYIIGATTASAELLKTAVSDGSSWETVAFPAPLSANATMITTGDKLIIADNETLYTSADGATWTTTPAAGISKLVGACLNEIYALSTSGDMMVSKDGGSSWNADKIDSDKAYLPTQSVSSMVSVTSTNADVSRIIIIGNRDASAYSDDASAMIWSKIVDSNLADVQPWAYQLYTEGNTQRLPCLSDISAVSYADGIIAIGGDGQSASTEKGFKQLYYSFDCGITWNNDERFAIPEGFSAESAALAVDKDKFIWIISAGSGQVWRGRLNNLGWHKDPVYFDK